MSAAYCGALAKGMDLLRRFLKGYAFQNRIRTITVLGYHESFAGNQSGDDHRLHFL
jgi:hypothetical protein